MMTQPLRCFIDIIRKGIDKSLDFRIFILLCYYLFIIIFYYFLFIFYYKAKGLGSAIAQAVSHRLPTAATPVETRVWTCGIL
jgi:hypothetical protein